MNAYRLYYSPGACSLASHIALEETGAPFDTEVISVRERDNCSDRYLAINPKARVPALAIPGEPRVLTETPAILAYLARRHPDARLLPLDDPLREARCHEWLAWLVGWVHGVGYGALWRPGRFVDDPAVHGAISAHGRGVIDTANATIEASLADGREWAEPGGHSIVDPFLLVLYHWGTAIGLDMTRHRAWSAHAQRVAARPAAQRALAAEGLRSA
ncbi:glutathione S-transferase [Burkholderia ubonensis]|uniref:glutathione S-transferase family protein n=1 Tax=Burkholderia ubonensis TaxID=101571 RepID=UPI0007552BEA|nr:glutathione S-transferase N-terminal domain-containing protein [Burkholderia ubonensis]KVN87991.1 glutathione S-transferase [Burkholderia ubonensis]KVO16810.1 glutathione S-transferase [Burkholderia ubonensis]KVT78360.1 glutathione S-transferase [Burkholderia ubonensis]KVU13976.1 glutathione S-transferase [Burkholderia ubonensis]KWC95848.1 glutathione S-transferase [Burkholderia ubonensis]